MLNVKLFEVLSKWNYWDKLSIQSGFPMEPAKEIISYLSGPEIIALKGVRRSGKSTIMFQIMKHILSKGVKHKQILYLNFEEPLFIEHRENNILEKLYMD